MLEKIKLLLNLMNDDSRDDLIELLINLCKNEAFEYCNLKEYSKDLDYIVIQMVVERFNRIGSEGATAQRTSGIETTYDSFYSEKVRKLLNKHRKIRLA